MGQFSWFTQDTHHRIENGVPHKVIMTDNKGNEYVEDCYEGYGVFGGKDYYELLAEMNGYTDGSEDERREKGIELAFADSPNGTNPNILHPSFTESGVYYQGLPPEPDPNQGFEEWEEEDY